MITRRRVRPALRALCAALTVAGLSPAALADERSELEQLRATTQALIQALVDQGLMSRERANALLRQAAPPPRAAAPLAGQPQPAAATPAAGGVVRVPYVPESVKAEIKEEIKNEVMSTAREERWADSRAIPSWLRNISLEGDIRVRAQGEIFGEDNVAAEVFRSQTDSPAWSPDLVNTETSRQRLTLRARLGASIKVSDDVSGGLRFVTAGSSGAPSSGSTTLGNHFNRLGISADRAWLRWEPHHSLRFEGGRIAVPFAGTDLLWPDDLSLDGVAARGEYTIASGLFAFANAGVFPVEEFAISKADKWLYGAQVGADWAVENNTQLRIGVGMYEFQNVEGIRETLPPPTGPRAGTTPYQTSQYPSGVRQRGNTLINLNDPTSTAAPVWGLASKFRPINVTAGVSFSHFDPYVLGVTFDYVKNTAFDLADIQRRAGVIFATPLADRTVGYQLRAQIGKAKLSERGDWQAHLAFRKFERDAWIDAFTDTTWHLGGTNYKGFSVGSAYTLDRNTTFGARWTSTRELDDGVRFLAVPTDPSSVSGNLSSAPQKIDVIQLEVNSRF